MKGKADIEIHKKPWCESIGAFCCLLNGFACVTHFENVTHVVRFAFGQLRTSPLRDLIGGNHSELEQVRRTVRFTDREENRVVMQIKAEVALTVSYVKGNG